jgi:hypothetical protein
MVGAGASFNTILGSANCSEGHAAGNCMVSGKERRSYMMDPLVGKAISWQCTMLAVGFQNCIKVPAEAATVIQSE